MLRSSLLTLLAVLAVAPASASAALVPQLLVNSPESIAGGKTAGRAAFGPPLTEAGVTGDLVRALDAVGGANDTAFDGCSPLLNADAVAGNVAFIDRGGTTCAVGFQQKVKNAQNAGAIAVVIGNVASSANPNTPPNMAGVDPTITIPAVSVGFQDGEAIRAALAAGSVNVTLRVVRTDTTPPVLTVPDEVTADATGPDGATVTFQASATDDTDPSPSVICDPASGSVFAIGSTTVTCVATDDDGNSADDTFTVVVRGAADQIGSIGDDVAGLGLHHGTENSLEVKLAAASAALDAGDTAAACAALQDFINHTGAQSGKKIPAAAAAELIAGAERVRAVLAC